MTTLSIEDEFGVALEATPADPKDRWQWAVEQYQRLSNVSRWAQWERGHIAHLACGEDNETIRSFAAEVGESKSVISQAISNYQFFQEDPEYVREFFKRGGTLKLMDVARRKSAEIGDLMDMANEVLSNGQPYDRTDRRELAFNFIEDALAQNKSANRLRDELTEQAAVLRNRIRMAKGGNPSAEAMALYAQAVASGIQSSFKDYGPETTWGPWGGIGHPHRLPGKLVIDLLAMTGAKRILVPVDCSDGVSEVCQELSLRCYTEPVYSGMDANGIIQQAIGNGAQDIDLMVINAPQVGSGTYDPNGLADSSLTDNEIATKLLAIADQSYSVMDKAGKYALFVRDHVDAYGNYHALTARIIALFTQASSYRLAAQLTVNLPDLVSNHTEPVESLIKHGSLLIFTVA